LLTTPPLGVSIAVTVAKKINHTRRRIQRWNLAVVFVQQHFNGRRRRTLLLSLYNSTSMEEDVEEEMMEGDMVD
jgi:hypothetical protein